MSNRFYFRILLIFVALLPVANITSAQTVSIFSNNTVQALEKQPAQEAVYLHLDKPNYTFGDTIWYKAYTIIGQHHQLSALSGVLYVELYNPADSLVTRQTLLLHSGIGWSDIPLPHNLSQGIYHIQAYTNWMRNFGSKGFYDQKIMVGGVAPQTFDKQSTAANPDVQFFPEGGDMLNGVRSRIAFKAIGADGLGVNIKGTIEDNTGNVITNFTTQHLGMGEFAFIPQSGKSYTAKISGAGETAFTVNLPPAKNEGYTLTLNNSSKDSIYIKIAVNDKTFINQKSSSFYLLAQSNGKEYYVTQGKLEQLAFVARIDKKRFPSGIAQFTLFNNEGKPIAERIAYMENPDTLRLKLSENQTHYTNKVTLQVTDENNKPVIGTFSAVVINESQISVDELSESTIMNYLMLISDLKGNIEQPNYYFTGQNDETRANLDLLMLTQGYRRLDWKQVLNDTSKIIKYMPEQSLEIAGTIKTTGGKPLPNGKVTLLDNNTNLFRDTTADINGNFKFINLYLPDSSLVVLKGKKENNSDNVKLRVTQPDYPAFTKDETGTIIFDSKPNPRNVVLYQEYQKKQKNFVANGIKLEEVKITAYKRKEPDLSESQNLNKGSADQVIMGDDLSPAIYLFDALINKISFIHLHSGKLYSRNKSMSLIVDGIIMDSSHINDIAPSDVYSVEVLRTSGAMAIYGSTIQPGGALVITLKHGGEKKASNNVYTPGIISVMINGFTSPRTFYTPKYTPKQPVALNKPLLETVFWKPNILTDKDGNASFEYNNNATKGEYRIVLEGIDDNGDLGRQVYHYNVE